PRTTPVPCPATATTFFSTTRALSSWRSFACPRCSTPWPARSATPAPTSCRRASSGPSGGISTSASPSWAGGATTSSTPCLPDARFTPLEIKSLLTGAPVRVYRRENPDDSEDKRLITNPDGFVYRDPAGAPLGTASAYRRYEAAMLVLSRRFSGRWQAQASYV